MIHVNILFCKISSVFLFINKRVSDKKVNDSLDNTKKVDNTVTDIEKMDTSYQSSPSSSRWSASSGSHTAGDLLQVQEMKNQIERLEQANVQLQNSYNSLNNQLQQALVAAQQAALLQDEVINLKKQLHDTTESAEAAKEMLNSQIIELQTKNDEYKAEIAELIESKNKESSKHSDMIDELASERDSALDKLNETREELKQCLDQLAKVTKQRGKSRERNLALTDEVSQLTLRYNRLQEDQESLANENRDQASLIEQLSCEIEGFKKQIAMANAELQNVSKEREEYQICIDILKAQLDTQKEDLSVMTDERVKLLQLIQRLNSVVFVYEENIEAERQKNISLSSKYKKAQTSAAPQLLADKFELENLNFPFTGEIKDTINKIANFDHFQALQKLQLILNELSKFINSYQEQLAEANKAKEEAVKHVEDVIPKCRKTYDLLHSILRSWKNFECNEQMISTVAFCDQDCGFLEFVAEECLKIENIQQITELLGPLFIPSEMFEDSNVNQRRLILDTVAQNDRDASALLSAMFLVNQRLKKQLDSALKGVAAQAEFDAILSRIGIDDILLIPSVFESLRDRILKLKRSRKEIHIALVETRNSLEDASKSEDCLKKQIEQLEGKIRDISQENDALRLQVSNLKLQRPNDDPPFHTTASGANEKALTNATAELKSTIKNLQKTVQEKSKENETLRDLIRHIKEENDQEIRRLNQRNKENECTLSSYIKSLKSSLATTEEKLSRTKKKAKNALKDIRRQNEDAIEKANAINEKTKTELNSTVVETKTRLEKTLDLVKNLQDELEASEKKYRALDEENARLHNAIKTQEIKYTGLQDQFNREQKAAQASSTARIINIENQYQRENKEIRAKLEKEKQNVIDFFTRNIGSLYGIVDIDYDESALIQLFGRIQTDLCKLKFFQEQATKY